MAYIGKSPQVGNYVKLDAITTSSTNTYNLTQDSVAFVPESALHMLVSLNGVIQSPLSSFSVSGSTITFLPSSGTLSSSDTIDFILVLGNTLDIGTPSDSTVTNAKTNFVSTSSSAGLQIKGDGTTDGTLQLNCSQNSHGVKIASPAHSAGQSYTLTLPTGNLTAGSGQNNIAINTNTNVLFDTERFDQNGDFSGSNTFTAPVTGRYQFNVSLYLTSLDSASAYYYLELQTSNELYYNILDPDFGQDNVYFTLTLSQLVDMDASDTAVVRINQSGGTAQTDINSNSFFSGYLVC